MFFHPSMQCISFALLLGDWKGQVGFWYNSACWLVNLMPCQVWLTFEPALDHCQDPGSVFALDFRLLLDISKCWISITRDRVDWLLCMSVSLNIKACAIGIDLHTRQWCSMTTGDRLLWFPSYTFYMQRWTDDIKWYLSDSIIDIRWGHFSLNFNLWII